MTQIQSLTASGICDDRALDHFLRSEEPDVQKERQLEAQRDTARKQLEPFWAPAREIADMCDACVVRSRGLEAFVRRWTTKWRELGQALQACSLLPRLASAEQQAIATGCDLGAVRLVTWLCKLAAESPAEFPTQIAMVVERLSSNEKTAERRFSALCTALWAYFDCLKLCVPGTGVLWEGKAPMGFAPDRCNSPADVIRFFLPPNRSTLDPLKPMTAAQIKNIAMFLLRDRSGMKATEIRDYWIRRRWPDLTVARQKKRLADDIHIYCKRGRDDFARLLASFSET